ncbi:MAG: exo-alpha-sialidase [Rhizomicrobium sp.]
MIKNLAVSLCVLSCLTISAAAQPSERAVGKKLVDGQAYVTLVRLSHQANPADNGRLLIAFEENGMDGMPIYESRDEGESWQLVTHATDAMHTEHAKCNLHWQPHLTEMPRKVGDLAAGTVLLSASAVCNGDNGRMASMQLQLYGSTDQGRSWQYRSTIVDGTAALPVWEPHLLVLDDGKLVTYYSSEVHKQDGYNQMLGHKVSADQGKSWGPEVSDTAFPGGVERPGMVIIARLANGTYVYNYEAVQGPNNGQVYIRFSKDGLHWGAPEDRGSPVIAQSGAYPINCPTVSWFPVGGPNGVLVVSARGAAGGGDASGRSFYWNNNNGVGPWWEAAAPVQKLMNGRAGWTQALMLKKDGDFLHLTSSASPDAPANPSKNEILFAAGKLNFHRYEAEDAARKGASVLRDPSMSNGAKSRLGAKEVGRLSFQIHIAKKGTYRLAVNYGDIGFASTPRLLANGKSVSGATHAVQLDPAIAAVRARDLGTRASGERMELTALTPLKAGDNVIEVLGGPYALDIDYLEITQGQ